MNIFAPVSITKARARNPAKVRGGQPRDEKALGAFVASIGLAGLVIPLDCTAWNFTAAGLCPVRASISLQALLRDRSALKPALFSRYLPERAANLFASQAARLDGSSETEIWPSQEGVFDAAELGATAAL